MTPGRQIEKQWEGGVARPKLLGIVSFRSHFLTHSYPALSDNSTLSTLFYLSQDVKCLLYLDVRLENIERYLLEESSRSDAFGMPSQKPWMGPLRSSWK